MALGTESPHPSGSAAGELAVRPTERYIDGAGNQLVGRSSSASKSSKTVSDPTGCADTGCRIPVMLERSCPVSSVAAETVCVERATAYGS